MLRQSTIATTAGPLHMMESDGTGTPILMIHGTGSSSLVFGRQFDSPLADAAGKLWALPYTAAGAAAGTLNVLAARLAGRKDARITLGNNAIQFENGLLGSAEPGAFTLGNSVLYGPGAHPGTKIDTRYDGQPTSVTLLGDHEMGHTY